MPEPAPAVRRSHDEWLGAPSFRTPLFGRESEIAHIIDLIRSDVPLVTITGQGGIGKTRVALEAARRTGYRLLFIQLAELNPETLAAAVARVMTAARQTPLDVQTSGRSRPTRVLLVLDTFDRLHGAENLVGSASVIGQARQTDNALTVLVTSRARLALSYEHIVPLAVTPNGPAVQMFRERALAAGGDLGGPGQDAAVAALCRRLQGVPLAIELAADRTTLLPPAALLARMQPAAPVNLLGILAHGPVDAPARHRSIRACLAWSYQLLDSTEQALLRRLGAFSGSFSLDAAEWVCAGPTPDSDPFAGQQVLNGLATLVDLHLVEPCSVEPHSAPPGSVEPGSAPPSALPGSVEPGSAPPSALPGNAEPGSALPGSAESGSVDVTAAELDGFSRSPYPCPRFALPEPVRAYATELLEMSGELADVRARMHDWCSDFADRAGRGVASAWESQWHDLIELELPTIRSTLAAYAKAFDAVRGVALVAAVADLWVRRGPYREGLTWLETFLQIDRDSRQLTDLDREMAVSWQQRLRLESGEITAVDPVRRARSNVVRRRCSPAQFHQSTDHLIHALLLHGEFTECLTIIDDGLARAKESSDGYWLSLYLFRRAHLQWTAARGTSVGLVLPYVEEALAVARTHGHARMAANGASLLGLCRVAQREWTPARIALTTAVADLHETGDRTAVVIAMQCLAAIHTELREAAPAAAWLLEAIIETRRIGYGFGEVYCSWGVAFLAARCGREDDAVRMDDALAEQLDAIQIGLPEVLVADYTTAMTQARELTGTGPRASRGHGWGWLRTRALQLAGELGDSPQPVGVQAAVRGAVQAARAATVAPAAAPGRPVNRGRSAGGAGMLLEQGHRSNGSVLHPGLTARELQILAAIASGQTNAQIAAELFLSAKTVMHHSTNIYRKLGVRGRAEAVALAYREGLLSGVPQ